MLNQLNLKDMATTTKTREEEVSFQKKLTL